MGTKMGTKEERALPSLSDLRDTLDEVLGDDALRDENRHTERMTLVCAVICDAFERCEMRATVVGGGAVEFHAPGAYTTLDNDLVVEPLTMQPDRSALNAIFGALGFVKGPARHWVRDDFLVEVPSSHLEGPAEEHQVGPHTFRVVKKEVLLVERLVEFYQTGHTGYGAQAIAMIRAFGAELELELLERLLREEEVGVVYELMKQLASSGVEITDDLLRAKRQGLLESSSIS